MLVLTFDTYWIISSSAQQTLVHEAPQVSNRWAVLPCLYSKFFEIISVIEEKEFVDFELSIFVSRLRIYSITLVSRRLNRLTSENELDRKKWHLGFWKMNLLNFFFRHCHCSFLNWVTFAQKVLRFFCPHCLKLLSFFFLKTRSTILFFSSKDRTSCESGRRRLLPPRRSVTEWDSGDERRRRVGDSDDGDGQRHLADKKRNKMRREKEEENTFGGSARLMSASDR